MLPTTHFDKSIGFLIIIVFYHAPSFILNYWLILFNYCFYCTNFEPYYKTCNSIGIPTKGAKAKIEIHPVKLKYRSIQYNLNTNLFVLLAHQFILL